MFVTTNGRTYEVRTEQELVDLLNQLAFEATIEAFFRLLNRRAAN